MWEKLLSLFDPPEFEILEDTPELGLAVITENEEVHLGRS